MRNTKYHMVNLFSLKQAGICCHCKYSRVLVQSTQFQEVTWLHTAMISNEKLHYLSSPEYGVRGTQFM